MGFRGILTLIREKYIHGTFKRKLKYILIWIRERYISMLFCYNHKQCSQDRVLAHTILPSYHQAPWNRAAIQARPHEMELHGQDCDF